MDKEEEMDSDLLLLGALEEATKHGGVRMLLDRWRVQEEKLGAFEESLKEVNMMGIIPTKISERIDDSSVVSHDPVDLVAPHRIYYRDGDDGDEVADGFTAHNASGTIISAPSDMQLGFESPELEDIISAPGDKQLGFESPELEDNNQNDHHPRDQCPEGESLEEFEKRIWGGLFKEQDFMLEQDDAAAEAARQEKSYNPGVELARYAKSEKLEEKLKQVEMISEPVQNKTDQISRPRGLDRIRAPGFHTASTSMGSFFACETSQPRQREAQIVKPADRTILTVDMLEGKLWEKLWEEWGCATTVKTPSHQTTKEEPSLPKFPEEDEEQQLQHERDSAESCQTLMLDDDSMHGRGFQKIAAACSEDELLLETHRDKMIVDHFSCEKQKQKNKKKKNSIDDRNNHVIPPPPLCGSQHINNPTDSNLREDEVDHNDDKINCRSFSHKLSNNVKTQITDSEDEFASRNLRRLRVCPGAGSRTQFQVDTDVTEELQIGDDDDDDDNDNTFSDQRTHDVCEVEDDNLSLLTRQRAKLVEDFMAAETERMKKRERDQVLKNEEVVRRTALATQTQEHLYVWTVESATN